MLKYLLQFFILSFHIQCIYLKCHLSNCPIPCLLLVIFFERPGPEVRPNSTFPNTSRTLFWSWSIHGISCKILTCPYTKDDMAVPKMIPRHRRKGLSDEYSIVCSLHPSMLTTLETDILPV